MALPKTFALTVDVISGAAIAAALMQWLPPAAAALGVVWYAIQIWESKTVQAWWVNHNHRSQLRKLAVAQVNATLAAQAATNGLSNQQANTQAAVVQATEDARAAQSQP